ncbi:pyridoxal-phosphate-dependent aminotransferase/ DegT/DnrJ/EryC1/StrS protein family [Synechococcus sp. RS9909]|uniref:DegT/DnrJ/EryC1/StrS family aminotransferase n=1 Tax=unclassified Synechococcus TaxID=2626047 RepID=UPI000069079A|nr:MULTISPECIES: DegT/DnrJ/EryC1/StrS aminotransferase family protein [unclassified Synechococcus]EAQ70085.1 putative eps aminotransferase protein [Synechococcus sp. RS9917]QNI78261.1 pyridoxal-phosphate-dependent aminotransferase/ DegT/DnrJ/EryC1/StrS protein family [Synechococcus sp. RS9909]
MNLAPWPHFDAEQINAATRVLASGKVNTWSGLDTTAFEQEFAQWCGTAHAIAMANGSLALSAAYLAIGLGEGDELITTPRTFIATASSAVLLGAKPVFADVDAESGAITAATIAPLITSRTKALSVVHIGGWPADMPEILELARSYGIAVIEDCAQAHGASIHGQSVGSFGDVNAWSFCQEKIISTGGEGGMVTTNRADLWDAMWAFKDHGKTHEAVFGRDHPPGFRWLHERFGSNFRLTELQSAIGRIQLQRLPEWTAARTRNALLLAEALADCSAVRVPLPPEGITHAWYKFYAFVKPEALADGWSRDRILSEIASLGYPALSGSCSEIYLEKGFQEAGLAPAERLPVARELGETSLMFLVHPTITPEQMAGYAKAVRSVVLRACR